MAPDKPYKPALALAPAAGSLKCQKICILKKLLKKEYFIISYLLFLYILFVNIADLLASLV